MQGNITGLHAGVVVDDNDPDNRYRVRVRVAGLYDVGSDPDGIPFAEVMFQGAAPLPGGSGDFRPFRKGDWVFVQFLGGMLEQPVVTGGCAAPVGGVPATPTEMAADSAKAKRRWVRRDRNGNTIELSENPEEDHVRLTSGDCEIIVSNGSGAITIRSLRGAINVSGAVVNVNASNATLRASDVTIDGDSSHAGIPNGRATVQANDEVDVIAVDPLKPAGSGTVNIGGRVDKYKGVPNPPPTGHPVQQSEKVNVRSREVNIGVGAQTNPAVDQDGGIPLLPTMRIRLRSAGLISLQAVGAVSVDAASVAVRAGLVEVSALATCQIKALGACVVNSVGPLLLQSSSVVTIQGSAIAFSSLPGVPPLVQPPVP